MAEHIAYLNGEFIPNSECKLHIRDSGIMRGDSVFDVERTFDGKIDRLRDHMERLYRSLNYVRIDPGLTPEEMEDLTLEVLKRNEPLREPGSDFLVTQFVTRGPLAWFNMADTGPATVCISTGPIDFSLYARFYQTGLHVIFPRTRSYSAQSLDPKVKHYSRMNFDLADLEATDVDPDAHAVLLDLEGNISENSAANFFIVTDGVIRTPSDGAVLQGITRITLFELASQLGIPTVKENLQPYDAYNADEAFLANTCFCVLPVGRIDKRPLREEVPGQVTKRLMAAWSERVGLDVVDQALQSAAMRGSVR